MSGAAAARPLDGLRILDLTHVLAGPYATGQLALLGAEVIRVERPGGDDFVRRHGGTAAMREAGLGASFLSQNAGKRSIAVNLKVPEGRELVLKLAETADAVVENFRPGVLERLGLGYDAVRARRPAVIYASLSGYGPEGPLAGRPAYDHILQGTSGLMAMTGTEESGPMRVGLPIIDYIAGQTLVSAVLAALLVRERQPEQPQRLHVSMLDAITGMMAAYAIHHQTTGELRGLEGNRAFSDSPFSGRFDTAEGQLVITANTPGQVRRLCEAIGRPGLEEEPDARRIEAELRAVLLSDTADSWEARLAEAHVPAARVRRLNEALAHPQLAGSPCWRELPLPELGRSVRAPALPFRASWAAGTEAPLPPAPVFGRDTAPVLRELGHDAATIARLFAQGVVAGVAENPAPQRQGILEGQTQP